MSTSSKPHRSLLAVAVITLAFAMLPLRGAVAWYGHPVAGILVDPDARVSSFGLPTWDGFRKGLRYPDEILSVDGRDLAPGQGHRAAEWDRGVTRAAELGHPSVHVRARAAAGEIELDLTISRLEPIAFWLIGGAPIGIAILYVIAALVALAASPRGRLSRTFAKTTLFAALFLFTLFDYHTARSPLLVALFHLSFAMVPMGFFALALRLPDDVPLLERHPWIVGALDAAGLALGLGMIAAQLLGGTTVALRAICSVLFAASFFFFAATFLVRFARATGDRRATLRALLAAMVPAHLVIGVAFVLGSLSMWGATSALCALPALALTPLSTLFALVRHDLWGSRALLSRVLIRMVIVAVTSACAIALGTGAAVISEVPAGDALLAAAVAGIVAGFLVEPALRAGDRALFPSRGAYKPTIEQLSEELTLITVPEEVGHAVERTVRRWLPCEKVEFCPAGRGGDEADASSGIRRLPQASSRPPISLMDAPPAARRSSLDPERADELSIDVLFRGHPLAVLRVGKKRGGALFTSEDLDLLRTIGNQAALALAHAYSYAELEQRRRQQAAAWRGEREALVETVAAEIAHEVRYPINYFRSIFRRGQGHLHLDEEDVDIGCDEVERLERLVSGLRRVAIRRLERHRLSVDEIVIKAERLLRDQLGERKLEVDIAGAPELRCDADQITQVLVNLISNALDAAGEEGEVGVSWEPATDGARLTVWDTGPGFAGDAARVFAPWYTTKPRGTGLGLAITHRIVRAHGWTIEPERDEGRTRFVIAVPHSDILTPLAVEPGAEVA